MLYLTMKQLHVACVVLSITGFCLRGLLLAQKSALAGRRLFRVLPHINDSLLLAAAISLTVLTGQYPFVDAWLTAKIFGLIGYIILGSLALKAGRPAGLRVTAGVAAMLVFGWIASVALTKSPRGFLA
jgi:uncharacterized membrane protein SirB2